MIQVTAREFRDKQASIFNLADSGQKVIIKRGKKQSYILIPMEDKDFILSPESEKRINLSRKQFQNGEYKSYNTIEDAIKFIESL